ncbi:gamma-glutamyl hydrolase [Chloropicon roscoffensis]|uniref:folate gamma-glutamyl hydrolase n=1 Tax=Chloropicon roscoffensis TaxID=1461544 RepID=A0AAX4P3Q4_9CHLO
MGTTSGLLAIAIAIVLTASTASAARQASAHASRPWRFSSADPPLNYSRPLIGIYTQDSPSSYDGIPGKNDEYIAASYAKLVEAAGARPVPVSYNLEREDLMVTLDRLDGFVFPGGGMDLSLNRTFAMNAETIVNYAQYRSDFPVVAICLGFQLVSTVVSRSNEILSGFDSENLLELPSWDYQAYVNSKLSQFYPEYSDLKQLHVFENHHSGVAVDVFEQRLSGFFDLLATGVDRGGKEYVAAVESKDYKIFGFQFHPEKATYEGVSAVLAYYARRAEATEGRRGLSEEEANSMLIYNVPAVFTAPYSDQTSFEQLYFFPKGYKAVTSKA